MSSQGTSVFHEMFYTTARYNEMPWQGSRSLRQIGQEGPSHTYHAGFFRERPWHLESLKEASRKRSYSQDYRCFHQRERSMQIAARQQAMNRCEYVWEGDMRPAGVQSGHPQKADYMTKFGGGAGGHPLATFRGVRNIPEPRDMVPSSTLNRRFLSMKNDKKYSQRECVGRMRPSDYTGFTKISRA